MSLSWRKRQAQASDQKSWRALGTNSALWKSIDRNALNVQKSLGAGNTSTTGIVTGIKLVKTEGLKWTATAGAPIGNFYISDPSNAAIAVEDGINTFDTNCPTGTSGKNLAISFVKYGSEDFKTQAVPHDISGIKYHILNGGQGYKVGDQITVLQGTNQYGKEVTVDTTTMIAGPYTSGAAIQQAAYKITHITATPGAALALPSAAGTIVSLSITGGADQTGLLHAPITAGGSQTIQIISPLDQNFDSALGDTLTIGTGPGVPCTDEVIPGVENSRKGAVSGFLTNASAAAGPVTGPTFYQTLAQFQTRQFEAVCSPYTLDATSATIITAVEAEKGTIQPFAATDAELATSTAALANTGIINGALIIEGRLTAEVTSVVSTKPEQGRN